jgi:DNA end-binding protein Ku
MAKQLIDSLAQDFDASEYKDEYREELLALIERKAKGEEIVEVEGEEPKPTKAPDLMAALEESLAAVKSEPLAEGSEKPAPKKRATGKKKAPAKKAKTAAKS